MKHTRLVGLALLLSFGIIYSCKKEAATQAVEVNAAEETVEKTAETIPEIKVARENTASNPELSNTKHR